MTISRFVLVSMFLVFALSCATTRRYEAMLDGWIGRSAAELEQKWGRPTHVGTYPDGRKLYEYRFSDRHEARGEKVRDLAGAKTGCTTFFVLSTKRTVDAWKWDGDDCLAK